jgi:hypothetical protein
MGSWATAPERVEELGAAFVQIALDEPPRSS